MADHDMHMITDGRRLIGSHVHDKELIGML